MSENPDELKAFGRTYGIDMQYDFKNDGTVDLVISPTGDIQLIGGSLTDEITKRRENAIQQIILRLLTPAKTLTDENGVPITFGSNLYTLTGEKNNEINRMAVRTYILSALADYDWIEVVTAIDVKFTTDGVMEIILRYKLINDEEIIEQILEYG